MNRMPEALRRKWRGKPYYSLNAYLRNRFGEKVYRVSLDAGFSCPNRDGRKGVGGCSFCDESGARAAYVDQDVSVREQLFRGMEIIRNRYGAEKFIAYFQAYSNTYAEPEKLQSIYEQVMEVPEVVGISIGTRPDCLPGETLEVLENLSRRIWLLVELGVQTVHDRTLKKINRGHNAEESFRAIKRIKEIGADTLAHLIFGLPGETEEDMLESLRRVTEAGVNGLKLHHLYLQKGSRLAKEYEKEPFKLFSETEYLEFLSKALPFIPQDVVIHRIFGQSSPKQLLAPLWTLDKSGMENALIRLLEKKGLYQGKGLG